MVDLVKARKKAKKESSKPKAETADKERLQETAEPEETSSQETEQASKSVTPAEPEGGSLPVNPFIDDSLEIDTPAETDSGSLPVNPFIDDSPEPGQKAQQSGPPSVASDAGSEKSLSDSNAPSASEDSDTPNPPESKVDSLEENEDTEQDLIINQYLTFGVGTERYAMSIDIIDEIIVNVPLTAIPNISNMVAGIMALRGKITTVIDARVRLGHPPIPPTEETRIIVIHQDDNSLGLLVDQVHQVAVVTEDQLEDATSVVTGVHQEYTLGLFHHENEMVVLLDIPKFIMAAKV